MFGLFSIPFMIASLLATTSLTAALTGNGPLSPTPGLGPAPLGPPSMLPGGLFVNAPAAEIGNGNAAAEAQLAQGYQRVAGIVPGVLGYSNDALGGEEVLEHYRPEHQAAPAGLAPGIADSYPFGPAPWNFATSEGAPSNSNVFLGNPASANSEVADTNSPIDSPFSRPGTAPGTFYPTNMFGDVIGPAESVSPFLGVEPSDPHDTDAPGPTLLNLPQPTAKQLANNKPAPVNGPTPSWVAAMPGGQTGAETNVFTGVDPALALGELQQESPTPGPQYGG